MKSNRLWTALLVALAVVLSAGVANAEKARPEGNNRLLGCSLQGTWHGYNTIGDSYVITIVRTGIGKFSAVGQSPTKALDPAVYPGVDSPYSTQGDLTWTEPGRYDSTWMSIFALDPSIWGFDLSALVSVGQIIQTSCDSWEVTFTWETRGYLFGQDPFEDGIPLFNGVATAYYKRLPKLPQ